jgi:hypothetical protein
VVVLRRQRKTRIATRSNNETHHYTIDRQAFTTYHQGSEVRKDDVTLLDQMNANRFIRIVDVYPNELVQNLHMET